MANTLNLYGDVRTPTPSGHGVDIASQRLDELDLAAIDYIKDFFEEKGSAPVVFDLGCGLGAQSARMAEVGGKVMAFDIDDNKADVLKRASAISLASRVSFVQMDIRKGLVPIQIRPDVVYSQRMIHYFKFKEAIEVLSTLREKSKDGIAVFISASGLDSELGEGYAHQDKEVTLRYDVLAPAMAEKHAMYGKVCLYSQDDMECLLTLAGLKPRAIYASPFGNIKAIATT